MFNYLALEVILRDKAQRMAYIQNVVDFLILQLDSVPSGTEFHVRELADADPDVWVSWKHYLHHRDPSIYLLIGKKFYEQATQAKFMHYDSNPADRAAVYTRR